MGIFDNISGSLKGVLGQVEATAVPALMSAALAKTNLGNLQGLVNQLQQGGLGPQVQSWLGSSANMSVTPEQLRTALGNDQVKELAAHFGLPIDQALNLLAQSSAHGGGPGQPKWRGVTGGLKHRADSLTAAEPPILLFVPRPWAQGSSGQNDLQPSHLATVRLNLDRSVRPDIQNNGNHPDTLLDVSMTVLALKLKKQNH